MTGSRILVVDDSATIRQVVQLVLSKAGHDVETANDGEDALEAVTNQNFDLILLDFVMPKVNGHQFCLELGKKTDAPPPIVLMSARGDQIGDRFVKLSGVVDYITKPFSPEALLAATDAALRKKSGGRRRALTVGPSQPANLLDNVRARLAKRLADAEILEHDKQHELMDFLDDRNLLELARDTLTHSGSAFALYGVLHVIPLAEVLQLLQMQSQTGVLWIHNRHRSARLVFSKGRIQIALGSGLDNEYAFGQILIRMSLLTIDELDELLRNRTSGDEPLGQYLVGTEKITKEDLHTALETQTCEIIYEALRWEHGSFEFEALEDIPSEASAALSLPVQGLVMEGLRRIDEWHLMERELSNFNDCFVPNEVGAESWGDTKLTEDEKLVLSKLDGKTSIGAIISDTHMASFDVANILFRFLSTKLIRRATKEQN